MNAKQQALRIVDALPESATWDDVLYAIYVGRKIARGIDDMENGRVVSDEEVRREFLKRPRRRIP